MASNGDPYKASRRVDFSTSIGTVLGGFVVAVFTAFLVGVAAAFTVKAFTLTCDWMDCW